MTSLGTLAATGFLCTPAVSFSQLPPYVIREEPVSKLLGSSGPGNRCQIGGSQYYDVSTTFFEGYEIMSTDFDENGFYALWEYRGGSIACVGRASFKVGMRWDNIEMYLRCQENPSLTIGCHYYPTVTQIGQYNLEADYINLRPCSRFEL